MRSPLLLLTLRGGTAERADSALWLDLDHGSSWRALCEEGLIPRLLKESGAEEIAREAWDGSPFGDGSLGTIEEVEPGVLACSDSALALPQGYRRSRS